MHAQKVLQLPHLVQILQLLVVHNLVHVVLIAALLVLSIYLSVTLALKVLYVTKLP